MNPTHYRDLIIRATQAGDMHRIDQLAAQLAQAEEARRLLQALTHCPACVASATARMVPAAPPGPPTRVVTLGRTSAQMQAAPLNSVFVWCNGRHGYPRALARHLGRPDIHIVSPSWVGSGRALGCAHTIVVDHAAMLSLCQRDEVRIINDHVRSSSANG